MKSLKDIVLYVIGDAFIKGVPLFLIYYLSQNLASSELAVIAKYLALFNFFILIGSLGQTSICNVHFYKHDNPPEYLATSLQIALLSFLFIFVIACFGSLLNALAAFVASIGWLFTNVLLLFWNSKRNVIKNILFEGLQSLSILLVTILVFKLILPNEWARISIHSLIFIVFGFFSLAILANKNDIKWRFNSGIAKTQIISGIAIAFCSLSNWVVFFGDKYILEGVYSTEVMGSFFLYQQFLYIYVVGALALNKALRPFLYNSLEQCNVKNVIKSSVMYLVLLVAGALISFQLFEKVVIEYLISEEYQIFSTLMVIYILIGYFLFALTFWIHQILIYFDLKQSMYLMYSLSLLVFLGLTISLLFFEIDVNNFPLIYLIGFGSSCCYGVHVSINAIKHKLNKVSS